MDSPAFQQLYARQEALSQIVGALLVESDPQQAVESLARRVMEVLDCQAFFNFLLAPERGRLRLNACAGIPASEAARIEWLDVGVAVCGCVARDGSRIVAEDIQRTPDKRTDLVRGYGIRAYACHPLLGAGGEVIGTLSFGTRTRDRFSADDIAYMKTVTDHIAIAMGRMRSAQELRRLNDVLESRVAERTEEARRLADRLRALAAELSQAEQRERSRLATILHDHIQQLLVAAHLQIEGIDPAAGEKRIQASVRVLDSILGEALEASRNLTIELSPPILKQVGLIAGLHWLVARMAAKNNFRVSFTADPEMEPAREDVRFLLFECVRELLFNALKHSGAQQADLRVARTEGSRIGITVEDTGVGFDPKTLAARNGNTAAFGLFSIQQRLAHVGGQASIESAPGTGTRVSLSVPLIEAPSRPVPPTPRRAAAKPPVSPADGKLRVLIVDDHKIMREGLTWLLKMEADLEVVGEAADGPQAIDLAEKLHPEVIIMDINLGEMSGVEATRIIVTRRPQVKVIGLSMHVDSDVAQSIQKAGAVAYLTKGGPSADLVAAIRACRNN
jgi:signal transduction histidine kinase